MGQQQLALMRRIIKATPGGGLAPILMSETDVKVARQLQKLGCAKIKDRFWFATNAGRKAVKDAAHRYG